MRDVIVAGVGMTPFGRFPDTSVRTLAEQATRDALADAAIEARDVGMVFFGNAMAGLITDQEMIRGQVALRHTGLLGRPLINVENACASGSTAVHLGWLAVASGQVDVAIAVGAEKMSHPEKARTMSALATAIDLEESRGQGSTAGHSLFMDIYAETARAYMEESGATPEDFAAVAVKARRFGSRNPRAQYRDPLTVADVLSSRSISPPLTMLMCSPTGDGAAAVVLTAADHSPRPDRPAVGVLASVLVSGSDDQRPSIERAVGRAFEVSGIGPDDLDVVEIHDAAAPAELTGYEAIGLCAPGDGPKLLAGGETDLGGRVPVNPSGGLLSKGHPVGATGCAQIVEVTEQLRGASGDRQVDGARIGLAQNGGGSLGTDAAAMSITILGRR
jgi:acetyl-CoA acetyltransferase